MVEAVRHSRSVMGAIRQLQTMDEDEIYVYAKEIRAPVELVRQTKHLGRCARLLAITHATRHPLTASSDLSLPAMMCGGFAVTTSLLNQL